MLGDSERLLGRWNGLHSSSSSSSSSSPLLLLPLILQTTRTLQLLLSLAIERMTGFQLVAFMLIQHLVLNETN